MTPGPVVEPVVYEGLVGGSSDAVYGESTTVSSGVTSEETYRLVTKLLSIQSDYSKIVLCSVDCLASNCANLYANQQPSNSGKHESL